MRVFVGCSSKCGVHDQYLKLAGELATFLANRGHKLVFSGLDEGMLGRCFLTFKYEDAKTKVVLDVNDSSILDNLEVNAYDVTPNTFRLYEQIYKSSEMIILLPGGIETIGALFVFVSEILKHSREIPIVLFNYRHYYTPLLNFLKKSYDESFISEKEMKVFDVVTDLESLEKYIMKKEKEREE